MRRSTFIIWSDRNGTYARRAGELADLCDDPSCRTLEDKIHAVIRDSNGEVWRPASRNQQRRMRANAWMSPKELARLA